MPELMTMTTILKSQCRYFGSRIRGPTLSPVSLLCFTCEPSQAGNCSTAALSRDGVRKHMRCAHVFMRCSLPSRVLEVFRDNSGEKLWQHTKTERQVQEPQDCEVR